MYVSAGQTTLVCPFVVVHKRKLLMSSSLLFQKCSANLPRLTWRDYEMGGKRPYSRRFVWCYFQDFFKTTNSILVMSSFLLRHLCFLWPSSPTPLVWGNINDLRERVEYIGKSIPIWYNCSDVSSETGIFIHNAHFPINIIFHSVLIEIMHTGKLSKNKAK